jgi:hypothetical protein
MPSQSEIDRFTLAFHQRAIARLRADPALLGRLDAAKHPVQAMSEWARRRAKEAAPS